MVILQLDFRMLTPALRGSISPFIDVYFNSDLIKIQLDLTAAQYLQPNWRLCPLPVMNISRGVVMGHLYLILCMVYVKFDMLDDFNWIVKIT